MYDIVMLNFSTKDESGKLESPPLGLLYIASYLQSKTDYTIKIMDGLFVENLEDAKQIATNIEEHSPKIVALTLFSDCWLEAKLICQELKKAAQNDLYILAGGPHCNSMPLETINKIDIDAVIVGEGEVTFYEICKQILSGKKDLHSVNGVFWKKNNEIIRNKNRSLIRDLDEIPFPARNLVNLNNYKRPGVLITSRGCLAKCIFCSSPQIYNLSFRMRSAKNVCQEIDDMINNHGIRTIMFADDTFTVDHTRLKSILKVLTKREIVNWFCESRIDTVNKDILKLMAKAGCNEIQFGIECSNQKQLNNIQKGLFLDNIKRVINWTAKEGIAPVLSFIIGFPRDTKVMVNQRIKDACKLVKEGASVIAFSSLKPYPGTEIFNNREKLGLKIEPTNWWQNGYKKAKINNGNLSNIAMMGLVNYGSLMVSLSGCKTVNKYVKEVK